MFLQQLAADEIKERLGLVNRTFTQPAVVCGFPDIWSGLVPNAHVVLDKDVLDLRPSSYDLVVHGMSLHWANDPVGQLVQARRALRPDGLFLGVLFGGQTLHELRSVLAEAEVEISGGLSPRVAPMAEIRDLGGLLQRAGFALPVADSLTQKVSYRDIGHLMHDIRAMGETNALSARQKRISNRALFACAAAKYSAAFPHDNGIEATFELVFLAGWAPSDNQPKPLRPGSAKQRLSDALGTQETPVADRAGPDN